MSTPKPAEISDAEIKTFIFENRAQIEALAQSLQLQFLGRPFGIIYAALGFEMARIDAIHNDVSERIYAALGFEMARIDAIHNDVSERYRQKWIAGGRRLGRSLSSIATRGH